MRKSLHRAATSRSALATRLFQADALTLIASTGAIGSSSGGEIHTNVAGLKATAARGAFVNESDGVTLDDVSAGDGGFVLNAAGADHVVGVNKTVTATNAAVTLNTAGSRWGSR